MPKEKLQPLIRGFRREQVVTTALRLFGERGTLEVPMEEIAADAGVSRSTLYNHFEDRNELLRACAESSHHRLSAALQKAIDEPGPPEVICARFLTAAFEALDRNPGFFRLATSLHNAVGDAAAVLSAELEAAERSSGEQVDRLVERLAREGELAVPAAMAKRFVGTLLFGALHQRANERHPPAAARAAAELARSLMHGVAKPPVSRARRR